MNYRNILYSASALLLLGAALTGCSESRDNTAGEGRLFISTSVSSDVKVVTRASEDELNEKINIWISSEKGLVRKYEGLQNVPADGIKLLGGSYVAEAWTGDSVSASWDARYFKAYQPFTITGGDVTVNLNCKIANVLSSVKYEETVDEVLENYTLTVGHSRGELTFEGRDERTASFMMPSTDTDLKWKLTGTKKLTGETFTKEDVIKNVKPAHEYVLNVKYTPSSSSVGGGFISIVVDDKEVIVENNVLLVSAPEIEGYGYDISQVQTGEPANMPRRSVVIKAACALKAVILESETLTPAIGGPDADLMVLDSDLVSQLGNAGINYEYNYDAENDYSWMKVNFEPEFLNALTEGNYTFTFRATDVNDRTTDGTLTVSITNASVAMEPVDPNEVYATSAKVRLNILKDDVTNPYIKYREQGGQWNTVPANVTRAAVETTLTDLKPGTTYECVAGCDGFEANDAVRFTTEAMAQLENAGFEVWNELNSPTANKAVWIPGSGFTFWDCGNHGSITMNKNVTTPESEIKHSGNYSAKLATQFVGIGSIGKLAAGNLFVGEYLQTDGTDGVLGWGRPFTSRPTALKGYVQYEPVAVTHDNKSKLPDVSKGDMDKGIIYIALVDGTLKSHNGKSYPVIVKTKTSELFSKTDANVIAYGEQVFDATNGMVEFNIPLDYVRNEKPSYIILVCSASKGGDYFVGGSGSIMYIDDFELVY